MAEQKKQSSPTDIVIASVGCVIAVILLYIYVLKPLVHPLFFYWKWLLFMPFFFIGKYIPNCTETVQNIFLTYRPEFLSRFDDMFYLFDTRFSDELLFIAGESGKFTFDEMIGQAMYYSNLSLLVFVPITLFYISKIKSIRTFQTLYNRETLLRENQKVFSSIVPIVSRDISKEDLNIGPWSMPQPPLFFSIIHKLLVVYDDQRREGEKIRPDKSEFFSLSEVYYGLVNDINSKEVKNANLVANPKSKYLRKENVYRKDVAAGLFIGQLGRKFTNGHFIGQLKRKSRKECGNYWRAVFAGMLYRFGASSKDKKKKAYPILDKFSKAFAGSGPVTASALSFCTEELVDELWDGFDTNYRFVTEVLPFVTFEYSFMMHLGNFAKKNGKLSPSDFLWLRPIDRLLYLSLDQIGARVGHVEALGPWSHYNGELTIGYGLHIPYVANAVEGLYLTLASEGWVPYHNIDYDQKSLLEKWEKDVDLSAIQDKKTPTEVYADFLVKGSVFAGWSYVWSLVRPLPKRCRENPFTFFSENDMQFFDERKKDFLADATDGIFVCDLTGARVMPLTLYPLWTYTVSEAGIGSLRLFSFRVFDPDTERMLRKWNDDSDIREEIISYFADKGLDEKELEDIFSLYSEIQSFFDSLSDWQYDSQSTILSDMMVLSEKKDKKCLKY